MNGVIVLTFFILLFAHLIGDFPLQGEFLANTKGKNAYLLAVHAGIWTGCIATAGYFIGFDIQVVDLSWLFVVHAAADYVKAKPIGIYKKLNPLGKGLFMDQSIHVVQILLFMASQ